jgi:cyclic pyranopterin phosphate synthase
MFPEVSENLKLEMTPPMRLTANFNGLCNLRCIMCDVWELPNGYYQEDNFWGPARTEIFPHLKEIDMLSGEPLIQADTFKLIDEVSQINPDCLWSITTNAHWTFNKKIKSALDKIKIKNLILSVDSFDPITYNKIRTPGNLNIVLKNIELLREYEEERVLNGQSPLKMNLNFVVQQENWKEVNSALHFCLDRDIHPFLTFCYRPNECSLLSFSLSQRKEILETYLQTMNWDEICLAHRIFSPLVDSLPPLDKAYFLDKMKMLKDSYQNRG